MAAPAAAPPAAPPPSSSSSAGISYGGATFTGPSGPLPTNAPSAPTLPLDTLTSVAASAAESVMDAYHEALHAARHTLPSFYVPPATAAADGKKTPSIAWNGHLYHDGEAFRAAYEDDMPRHSFYEVQSVDAQVLFVEPEGEGITAAAAAASNGDATATAATRKKDEDRVRSVLVNVSGFVRLHEPKDGPARAFSETFVLVRNPAVEKERARGLAAEGRRWCVQSQVFRYIV